MNTTATGASRSIAIVRAEDFTTAGAVVWWELDGRVDAAALASVWTGAGLDPKHLPPNPSPEAALHRAVRMVAGKQTLIRPLPGRGAWALVSEARSGTEDLDYSIELRARLQGGRQVDVSPAAHPLAPELLTVFNAALLELTAEDVSAWLISAARRFRAVALRTRGGFYFVPRTELADWHAVRDALTAVSDHLLYEIPALPTADLVQSLLDSVTREAEIQLAEMDRELSAADLGARGLRSKALACTAAAAKVSHYEELLGRALPGLHRKLEGLQARIAAAALATI